MAVAGAFIVPHPPLIVPEIGSQRVLLKGVLHRQRSFYWLLLSCNLFYVIEKKIS